MNRTQKAELVGELETKLKTAKVAVLAWQSGLSVIQANRLRREIREAGGETRVAKNTLTRRAVSEGPASAVEKWLEGQTTLFFGYDDPVAVTKIVARWAEEQSEKLSIKGGLFEGEVVESGSVVALSKTPPMDVLRAKLLGLLQAPAGKLVRLLAEPGSQLARALAAREKTLGGSGGSES